MIIFVKRLVKHYANEGKNSIIIKGDYTLLGKIFKA